MRDCRNARVRLRRRLERGYSPKRVSVKAKQAGDLFEPKIMVSLDLNERKDDFIDDAFANLKEKDTDFTAIIEYLEDDFCNYTITFLVNSVDVGVNKIKMIAISELIEKVVSEMEIVHKEVKFLGK